MGAAPPPGATLRLAFLFGTLYFVQGFGEPTEGLVAQPTRSLLKGWGYGTEEITRFMFVLGLPWLLKPLLGLLSDFVPLGGSHRRNYLLATTLLTTVGLAGAWSMQLGAGAVWTLLALLLLPSCGIAFSDVVADAHMVETGQPLGITGRLQSVQWASLYSAGVLTGFVGGWLTEHGLQAAGYLLCGLLALVSFSTCWGFVKEPPRPRPPAGGLGQALRTLLRAASSPVVVGVGGFMFLLNFNPFSSTILNEYVTEHLRLSEQDYGIGNSCLSAGAIAACVAYGAYCRAISRGALIHLSIFTGVLCTLLYWGLSGRVSLMVVSVLSGFCYMTAGLVSLDLAARACDPTTAGTVFALLMALCNLSVSLAGLVGGELWARLFPALGPHRSYQALVGLGALCTAGCWVLVWAYYPLLVEQTGPAGQAPLPGPGQRGDSTSEESAP